MSETGALTQNISVNYTHRGYISLTIMPKSCVVVGCTVHNMMTDKKRCFFELPKRILSPNRRDKWLQAIHRVNPDGSHWSPAKSSTICSDHFVTGRPVKTDENHPDFVPSIFPHKDQSQVKARSSIKRYQRYQGHVSKRQCSKRLPFTPPSDTDKQTGEYLVEEETLPTEPGFSDESSDSSESVSEQQKLINTLYAEIEFLRKERDEAVAKVSELEDTLKQVRFTSASIENDDSASKFYTGVSWAMFEKMFHYLVPFMHGKTKDSMAYMDQFFITLVRLRQNVSFELLARLSGYGESTIRDYFWKWVDVLYAKLSFMVNWPDRECIWETLPVEFRHKYPRLTTIIDCFEVFLEQPGDLKARSQCYSNYKKHTTVKVLLACTPLGAISYISPAWGGRVSDVELVRSSGFISRTRFHPRDQILADRGFTLEDDFATMCSAELIIPSWTKGKSQLPATEYETSKEKSNIRIHVERVIGLLKNRYTVLHGTLPIKTVKSLKEEADKNAISNVDRILTVCAALCNMGDGIV